MRHVTKQLPEARLLIAGSGSVAPLRRLSKALHLEDRISWLGAVPHGSMSQLYARGHLYVQTSAHEAQGMSVLEALACGLLPVGTPVGILPEVSPGEPTFEPRRLADQIVRMWQSGALTRSETRRRAHEQAVERFCLPAAGDVFERLYSGLAVSGRASSAAPAAGAPRTEDGA
jgi:glycosyltransferase involved in cell wall biosynthesis